MLKTGKNLTMNRLRNSPVLKYALGIFILQIVTVYIFIKATHYFPNLKDILTLNNQGVQEETKYGSQHELKEYKVKWSEVKLLDKVPRELMHDKWIVLTTINPPTEDVKKLAAIPDWKVVVVGDTKSPKDWSHPNCIFLDVKKQLALGYQTTKLLKYKSYARKSIGFLYAIQHGAKVIYETDDDNSPTIGKIGFDPESSLNYLVYHTNTRSVVNPYAHFGQSSIWPRGYPLDKIGDEPIHTFRQCNKQRALVQQGVVNGDPDVDAIYRITRKDANVNLTVSFDSNAKPVLLPKGIMAPYNSQNTLHLYDAFWGLLLPQTVAFRVCDIWRGYWTQRLLWEIDGNLAFFPPNAFTFRNAHNYLEDFIDEKQLYHDSGRFVNYLKAWRSNKKHFFDRVIDLSFSLVSENFWESDDTLLVKYWLMDLVSIGYKPPTIGAKSSACDSAVSTVLPNEQASSYLRSKNTLKKLV